MTVPSKYWLIVHTLCNQLVSELILDLFNILHTCYMHIEHVHEKFDAEKNVF